MTAEMRRRQVWIDELEGLRNFMRALPDLAGTVEGLDSGWIGTEGFTLHLDGDKIWAFVQYDYEAQNWYATFPDEEVPE